MVLGVALLSTLGFGMALNLDVESAAGRPCAKWPTRCGPPGTTGTTTGTTTTGTTTTTSPTRLYAVIGNDSVRDADERAAGVTAKVVSLSWRKYFPSEGTVDAGYVSRKRDEFARARTAGFKLILSLGYHDTPAWMHANYANSYYVNQYGERYTGTDPLDNGDANFVFNTQLRGLVAAYLRRVFSDLGTDFYAVRLGGGRYGELTYPPASYGGRTNLYWSYDVGASSTRPTGAWRPGEPSPNSEAKRFLDWHLQALVGYQNWQVATLRQSYGGKIMMLYPSWGIRPTQADAAVSGNLSGATSAERNGEVQRGYDFARQVAAINDPQVLVTTTWLDANVDIAADGRADQRYWSPVKYLASLAQSHPLRLGLYGENTGQGDRAAMDLTAAQMVRFGLTGMAWYRESELFSGVYATLDDLRATIARYR